MNKHYITLRSLTFCDKRGNFIVREEYKARIFRALEWLNKFLSERKQYYQDLYKMELTVAPQHRDTLHPDHIVSIFESVGEYFELRPGEIFKKTRRHEILHPRWFAMKICSDRGLTEEMIGEKIGFNHSTVNNGKVGSIRLMMNDINKQEEFNRITDFALFSLNGEYKSDGSGEEVKAEPK